MSHLLDANTCIDHLWRGTSSKVTAKMFSASDAFCRELPAAKINCSPTQRSRGLQHTLAEATMTLFVIRSGEE